MLHYLNQYLFILSVLTVVRNTTIPLSFKYSPYDYNINKKTRNYK